MPMNTHAISIANSLPIKPFVKLTNFNVGINAETIPIKRNPAATERMLTNE